MINDKNLTVFVYSSTGHTRCTSVALTYLSLFQMHPAHENLNELAKFIKTHCANSIPNMQSVKEIDR